MSKDENGAASSQALPATGSHELVAGKIKLTYMIEAVQDDANDDDESMGDEEGIGDEGEGRELGEEMRGVRDIKTVESATDMSRGPNEQSDEQNGVKPLTATSPRGNFSRRHRSHRRGDEERSGGVESERDGRRGYNHRGRRMGSDKEKETVDNKHLTFPVVASIRRLFLLAVDSFIFCSES